MIKFVGNYAASKGQAAALVTYVFFGEHVLRKALANDCCARWDLWSLVHSALYMLSCGCAHARTYR